MRKEQITDLAQKYYRVGIGIACYMEIFNYKSDNLKAIKIDL